MPEEKKQTEKKANLQSEIREYIEKRVQLVTINMAEQVTLIVSRGIQQFLGFLILGAAAFFLWFGVGFLIGNWIGSTSGGFAIGSIPLFIFGYIFLKTRSKSITDRIQAELISNLLNNLDTDAETDSDKQVKQIENGKEKK